MRQWRVGILIFNDAEVLDFTGPFEVFSLATIPNDGERPFVVNTVSETGGLIAARNGLKVQPDYGFDNAPMFDIVVVPGGYGAEEVEIHNDRLISWIVSQSANAELMTSVCTGAFLLAKAGLLDGKKATTHWIDIDRFEKEFPHVRVLRNVKYVDQGFVMTSAGISAGINMSFHIVKKLLGEDVALATAKRMEYDIAL